MRTIPDEHFTLIEEDLKSLKFYEDIIERLVKSPFKPIKGGIAVEVSIQQMLDHQKAIKMIKAKREKA